MSQKLLKATTEAWKAVETMGLAIESENDPCDMPELANDAAYQAARRRARSFDQSLGRTIDLYVQHYQRHGTAADLINFIIRRFA